MAIGAHTGDWPRALEECGDDKGELIAAIEQVAERDSIDVTRTLSDFGHMTPGTRELWSQRLQFVTYHSLGKRSQYQISPRYDVPAEFFKEQDAAAVLKYVDKLVEIGIDTDEMVINRAAALAAAGNVIQMLPSDEKKTTFQAGAAAGRTANPDFRNG